MATRKKSIADIERQYERIKKGLEGMNRGRELTLRHRAYNIHREMIDNIRKTRIGNLNKVKQKINEFPKKYQKTPFANLPPKYQEMYTSLTKQYEDARKQFVNKKYAKSARTGVSG